ncbi:hypothetical protein QFZ82_006539 [Streptomyces sp. V4I23]|uniref:hypothetical protein n=1 Tax=Streptomyces sp. V4I23 TaxID=3042282 RepID=UPI00278419C6|nr:hypothetical protein [Streptomyces sp. V4I23]MDQ1012054.1 hypothetical protein [Streptomyces sp. V4I23]
MAWVTEWQERRPTLLATPRRRSSSAAYHGALHDPSGLDVAELLTAREEHGDHERVAVTSPSVAPGFPRSDRRDRAARTGA